jgi:hypothetical protein
MSWQLLIVELVVYPDGRAYPRYAFGKRSIEEKYRRPALTRRRRKRLRAQRNRKA